VWRPGQKARKNVKGLLEVVFPHGKEVFDYSTGAAILDGRRAIDQSTWFRDKAAQFRSGVPVGSLTDLQAEVLGILDDPFLRGPERTQAVRLSLAHAVRSGWDVTDLLDQWDRGANKGPIKRAAFRNAIADPQFLTRASGTGPSPPRPSPRPRRISPATAPTRRPCCSSPTSPRAGGPTR
jgi:hypothetical protein